MSDKVTILFDGDTKHVIDSIDATESALVDLGTAADTAIDGLSGATSAASSDFDGLRTSILGVDNQLSAVADAGEDAGDTLEDTAEGAADDFDELVESIKSSERGLEDLGSRASSTGGMLQAMLMGAVAGAATGGVMLGVQALSSGIQSLAGAIPGLVDLYGVQEAAENKLAAALKATGNVTGFTQEQLQGYASQLQNLTTVGDETIIGVQALITSFKNVRGDEFLRATELSLDLAQALGKDTKEASLQLGKALNDPIAGMSALNEVGIKFTDEQKKIVTAMVEAGDVAGAQRIMLDELAGVYGGSAAAAAETFAGRTQQLWNRVGDLGEALGGVLVKAFDTAMPYFDMAVVAAENLVGGFTSLEGGLGFVDRAIEGTASTLKWFVDDIMLPGYVAVETGIANLDKVWQAWGVSSALSLVRFGNDVEHVFGTVVPDLLGWLSRNWPEVFLDIANFQSTVLKNMGDNVTEFFTSVWAWMSGDEASFEFKALTDGFESSLKELPRIAERHKSDLEKALEVDLENLTGDLAGDFEQRLDERRKQIEGLFVAGEREALDLTNTATPAGSPVSEEVEDVEATKATIAAEVPEAVARGLRAQLDKLMRGEGADPDEDVSSTTEDLESLYNRISNAAASDPAEKKADDRHREQIAELQAQLQVANAIDAGVRMIPDSLRAFVADAMEDPAKAAGEVAFEFGEGLGDLVVGALDGLTNMVTPETHVDPGPEESAVNATGPDPMVVRMDQFIDIAMSVARALPLRGTLG